MGEGADEALLRRRPGEPGGPGREKIENNKWQQVFMGVALSHIL